MPAERQRKIADRSKALCVEVRLAELLDRVWRGTVSVKSNLARDNAEIVAMAASLHMLTTKTGVSTFANEWQITNTGLTWLNEREHAYPVLTHALKTGE
jgi:hypothetical protein